MDESGAELEEEGGWYVASAWCCREGEAETLGDRSTTADAAFTGWAVSASTGCYGWEVMVLPLERTVGLLADGDALHVNPRWFPCSTCSA